jgi:SOS response regulatory protein OraA/RecX
MKEIDDETYHKTLLKLIKMKKGEEKNMNFETRAKIARYLIQKGFETDIVWKSLSIDAEE